MTMRLPLSFPIPWQWRTAWTVSFETQGGGWGDSGGGHAAEPSRFPNVLAFDHGSYATAQLAMMAQRLGRFKTLDEGRSSHHDHEERATDLLKTPLVAPHCAGA